MLHIRLLCANKTSYLFLTYLLTYTAVISHVMVNLRLLVVCKNCKVQYQSCSHPSCRPTSPIWLYYNSILTCYYCYCHFVEINDDDDHDDCDEGMQFTCWTDIWWRAVIIALGACQAFASCCLVTAYSCVDACTATTWRVLMSSSNYSTASTPSASCSCWTSSSDTTTTCWECKSSDICCLAKNGFRLKGQWALTWTWYNNNEWPHFVLTESCKLHCKVRLLPWYFVCL